MYRFLLKLAMCRLDNAASRATLQAMFDVIRIAYWFEQSEDCFADAEGENGIKYKHKDQMFADLKAALRKLEKVND